MASKLFYLPFRPALDANAIVVTGAQLFFYATGTTTPQAVYSDSGLETALPNPVEANSAGVWPSIYLNDALVYRCVLKDAGGATLAMQDPYLADVADALTEDLQDIADAAAASAGEAGTAAALATTNGAAQVALATAQVALAEQAVTDATAQVALAEAAVAATFQNAGRYIPITEALQEGGVFADFSIPAGVTFTRLFARILGGSGTVDITVLDDGYPVHGPVTVTYGTDTDDTISETIATGSDISFWLDNITGAPMGLICKVEGAPA